MDEEKQDPRVDVIARGMEERWLKDPNNGVVKLSWPEKHRKAYFDANATLILRDLDSMKYEDVSNDKVVEA